MKNVMKRIFSFIMVLLMCIGTFSMSGGVESVNAENVEGSNNLNAFITAADFTGAQTGDDGKLILYPGETYKVKLSFKEVPGSKQMETDNSSALEYTYPSQLDPVEVSNQSFNIVLTEGNNTYVIPATYSISGQKLSVVVDKNSDNYQKLHDADNVEFSLNLEAVFNSDKTEDNIEFGNNLVKEVTVNSNGSLTVNKSVSKYDEAAGKIWYQVDVTSTGHSKNVNVTDAITGTALSYDQDSLTITSDKRTTLGGSTTNNTNGFTYNISEINNGEKLTLKYSATVDYSKLNGNTFTVDETKNTITAKGDNTEEKTDDADYKDHNTYTHLEKSSISSSVEGNTQTTNWTITVNPNCKVYKGGTKITDTLSELAGPTTYSGTGLTVTTYDANGNTVGTTTTNWSDLNVSESSQSFEYTIPTNDSQAPYKYVITYTTSTNNSSVILDNQKIKNTVSDGSESKSATADVTKGGTFAVDKSHFNASASSVDWTVSVDIPKSGFSSSFVITDSLPETWVSGTKYADTYIDGSMTIKLADTELTKDTDYTLSYTAPANNTTTPITITFTSTGLSKLQNLDSAKKLVLTYKTKPNENWPEGQNHTNTVNVEADGNKVNDTDNYRLATQKVTKSYINKNTTTVNNVTLPYYEFGVLLSGVDSDTVTVTDTFDTSLFEVMTDGDYRNIFVGKGDNTWDGTGNPTDGGTVTVQSTESGATFTLTPTKKDNGGYYNYYRIIYRLRVKDADALKSIKEKAAENNGKYTVENTATFGTSSQATGEYDLQPMSKTVTVTDNTKPQYTVTINGDKLTLNNGQPYTVNDQISIQSGKGSVILDPTSVVIETEPAEKASEVSYKVSADSKSMNVTVPDNTKVVVKYSARVISTGTITYKNDAKIGDKYSASSNSQTYTYQDSGSGTAEIFVFTFEKLDEDDQTKKLPGATYQLFVLEDGTFKEMTKSDGSKVTFTTDANGQFEVNSKDEVGNGYTIHEGWTYKLKEISAPKGYKIGAEKTFTVLSNKKETETDRTDGIYDGSTIYLYDKQGQDLKTSLDINVTKNVTVTTDSSSKASTKSFSFELYKSDAEKSCAVANKLGTITVDTAETEIGKTSTSAAKSFTTINDLTVGTYYYAVKEVANTSAGWSTDNTVHLIEVNVAENEDGTELVKTVKLDGTKVQDSNTAIGVSFTNTYDDTKKSVTVSKKAVNGSSELAGATLQVIEKSTNTVKEQWTSGSTEHVVSNLVAGTTYILRETVAPTGYTITSDSEFTIDAQGNVSTTGTVKNNNGVLLIEDTLTNVKISKTDITGDNELAGATLQILKDDKVIQSWTSENKVHEVTGLETGVTYTLRETVAPEGYAITTDTTFTLNADGTIDANKTTTTSKDGVLLVKDAYVEVSKVDITTDEELDGAYIQVLDKDSKVVDEWTSKKGEKHKVKNIKVGETYTLKETTAPTGYQITTDTTFSIDKDGKITTTASLSTDGTILIKDTKSTTTTHPVNIKKTDVGGEEIEGAKLTITKNTADGEQVAEWTSEKGKTKVVSLEAGTYVLTEVTAPNGYEKAESITFVVDENGKVTVNNEDKGTTVTMVDKEDHGSIIITKTIKGDVTKEEAEGSLKFEVTNTSTSKTETYTLKQFEYNNGKYTKRLDDVKNGSYKVTETVTDIEGHTLKSVTYTINGKTTVQGSSTDVTVNANTTQIDFEDDYESTTKEVEISKEDISGKELEGAKLTVTDKDGKEVTSWTSGKTTTKIKVQPGTYTLTETTAPKGYEVAESIEFTVDKDGKVTVGGKDVNGKVTMTDKYSDQTVTISKTTVGGKELPGAVLTVKGKNFEETWTSTNDVHIIKVKPGTYTLHEDTAPAGYKVTNDITFVVNVDGTVTVNGKTVDKITMIDESKESKTADTSDKNNVLFYAGMLAFALSGMIVVIARRKMDLQ